MVHDVQPSGLLDGLARPAVYVPTDQQYVSSLTIVARKTRGQRIADELRALPASMTANVPVILALLTRSSLVDRPLGS